MIDQNNYGLKIVSDINIIDANTTQKEITFLKNQLDLARDEIAELQDEIAIKTAARNAFEAQVMAFVAQHPDSHLNASSGHHFKNGECKSKIWTHWEVAFDASLKTFGFENPASRRID